MRKFLLCFFLLLSPVAFAQGTGLSTLSGTVTDGDGQTWNNAVWSATLNNPGGFRAINICDPAQPAVTAASGTLSNTGVFSGTITRTDCISPGITWNFSIQSNTSAVPSLISSVAITTATFDLGTFVSSRVTLPRFAPGQTAFGYLDGEVIAPVAGSSYFNVTSKLSRIYDGTTWNNNGGLPTGCSSPVAGSMACTGSVAGANLNVPVICPLPGVDIGPAINTVWTNARAAGYKGVVADMSACKGVNSLQTQPFSAVGYVYGGNSTFTASLRCAPGVSIATAVSIVIPGSSNIDGVTMGTPQTGGTNYSSCLIQVDPAFPINTPIIQFGAASGTTPTPSNGQPAYGVYVANLNLSCATSTGVFIAGCYGVQNQYAQEGSYVNRVNIFPNSFAIQLDSPVGAQSWEGAGNSGPYDNINSLSLTTNATASTSWGGLAVGLNSRAGAAPHIRGAHNWTIAGTSNSVQPLIGIDLNGSGGDVAGIHCEGVYTCVEIADVQGAKTYNLTSITGLGFPLSKRPMNAIVDIAYGNGASGISLSAIQAQNTSYAVRARLSQGTSPQSLQTGVGNLTVTGSGSGCVGSSNAYSTTGGTGTGATVWIVTSGATVTNAYAAYPSTAYSINDVLTLPCGATVQVTSLQYTGIGNASSYTYMGQYVVDSTGNCHIGDANLAPMNCTSFASTNTANTFTASQHIGGSATSLYLDPIASVPGTNSSGNSIWASVYCGGCPTPGNLAAQLFPAMPGTTGNQTYTLTLNGPTVGGTGWSGASTLSFAGWNNTTSQSIQLPIIKLTTTQTVVNCATSGTVTYAQTMQGQSNKKVIAHLAACLGAAPYTYASAFANTPGIFASSTVASSLVTSLSQTAVTITGSTSTGTIILEDY